jgi:hypothetical protein
MTTRSQAFRAMAALVAVLGLLVSGGAVAGMATAPPSTTQAHHGKTRHHKKQEKARNHRRHKQSKGKVKPSQRCPEPAEVLSEPGPTSVVGGIYEGHGGGPLHHWRPPDCPPPASRPLAGNVTITNSEGTVIATETLAEGQTFDVAVSPGTYTVSGNIGPPTNVPGERACSGGPVTVLAGRVVHLQCGIAEP